MQVSTTTRLREIDKMESILLGNDYGILYDKEDNSNHVIFKKIENYLWLRFQRDYPFGKDEFEYFESFDFNRLRVPWEYFSLIFQTLWFKYDYTHKFQGYLFPYKQQVKFAWFNFVDIIWERQGFQPMRNEILNSKILVILQPQGSKSKVFIYFDQILSQKALDIIRMNVKVKVQDNGKTLRISPYKDRIEKLGKILLINLEYKF